MKLLAIDPGNVESALLVYNDTTRQPEWWGKLENARAISSVERIAEAGLVDAIAIEMVASYGMAVGATVFDTCVWIGRFFDRWVTARSTTPELVYRRDVKLHLCNSAKAKDANVRQALIDRYGGKEQAIGKKANPGPLYGISGDCWSALGVAITATEREPV